MKGTRVRDDKSIKIRLYKKEKVFFIEKKEIILIIMLF